MATIRQRVRRVANGLRGVSDQDHLRDTGLQLGENVHIGYHTIIDASHRHLITIGDDVVIAPRVHILAHDASTKPLLGYTRIGLVNIGPRVFIGAGSLILPGVTIGEGSIIAAGSIVSRSIPAGSVAAGSPAVVVSTVEEYRAKRCAEFEQSPRWSARGWTVGRDFTPERAASMRADLQHSPTGFGYVE